LILTRSAEITIAHLTVCVIIVGERAPRFFHGYVISRTIVVGLFRGLEGKHTLFSIRGVHLWNRNYPLPNHILSHTSDITNKHGSMTYDILKVFPKSVRVRHIFRTLYVHFWKLQFTQTLIYYSSDTTYKHYFNVIECNVSMVGYI